MSLRTEPFVGRKITHFIWQSYFSKRLAGVWLPRGNTPQGPEKAMLANEKKFFTLTALCPQAQRGWASRGTKSSPMLPLRVRLQEGAGGQVEWGAKGRPLWWSQFRLHPCVHRQEHRHKYGGTFSLHHTGLWRQLVLCNIWSSWWWPLMLQR